MPPKRSSRRAASVESSPNNRRRTSRRTDLSGLDLDSEVNDDDEYSENQEEEEDDANDTNINDDDINGSRKRSRNTVEAEDEDPEDDAEGEEEEDEEEEEEEEEAEPDVAGQPKVKVEKRQGPKKRGRKKTKLTLNEDGAYYDEDGNLLNIKNDEVVIDDEDPKGAEKIDENGNLKDGRKFINKTFTVLGQGDRKYMISTEPARLVGFRDSYLLFKTHTRLFKKVCTNEEKMDLIERNIIPNSYKGRSVNLVTARLIFREFGAKILENGRKVIDDFWEQQARDNGDIEGEYADPTELYNFNMNRNSGIDPSATVQPSALAGAALVSYQTDPTWMYQIAMQTREYNSRLLEERSQAFGGIKDVYTGLTFVPNGTQPTKHEIQKVGDSSNLRFDIKFGSLDIRRKFTNLKSIPKHLLDCLSDEIKEEVLKQIKFEEGF